MCRGGAGLGHRAVPLALEGLMALSADHIDSPRELGDPSHFK